MIDHRKNTVVRLQYWYKAQCNEDWEHNYGITINNIDNPGWLVEIDLQDTQLYNKPFQKIDVQRKQESDWFVCEKTRGQFIGYCGPNNLEELLGYFLDWADSFSQPP